MRHAVALFFTLISGSIFAQTLTVVDSSVCKKWGSKLRQCNPPTLTFPLDHSQPDYVPLESLVNIRLEGNCSTAYPIWLDFRADGLQEVKTIELFSQRQSSLNQNGLDDYNAVTVEVDSPYSRIATYDQSCRILADITPNSVNIPQLKENLRPLKAGASGKLNLLRIAIGDKQLLIDMIRAVNTYERVLALAELDRASVGELNALLDAGCEAAEMAFCSWEEYIVLITDSEEMSLTQSQRRLLEELSYDLDAIVPGDCGEDNCIEPLVSEQVRTVLDDMIAGSPSLDQAKTELAGLEAREADVLLTLNEYQRICAENGVEWGEI